MGGGGGWELKLETGTSQIFKNCECIEQEISLILLHS